MSTQLGLQAQTKEATKPNFTPMRMGLLQRKCACGNHAIGGECEECKKKKGVLQRASLLPSERGIQGQGEPPAMVREVLGFTGEPLAVAAGALMEPRFGDDFTVLATSRHRPVKALGISPEEKDEERPSPTQGPATIQCNGSGDYEIVYGGWAGATCGTKDCVTTHEGSHIADWKAKWPAGCRGQAKGYLPKGTPPDNPVMTDDEYRAFLKESECKAYTADLACAEALPKQKGCEKTIDDYIKSTKELKDTWCHGLSRAAKLALGLVGGALLGAGIGALVAGGAGAASGLGAGLLAGGISGVLF